MSHAADRVESSGQARFVGLLLVSSLLFAVGVSVTLFGATTEYLTTTGDRLGAVAVGVGLLAVGVAGAYWTLS